jgi:hypothetical protein
MIENKDKSEVRRGLEKGLDIVVGAFLLTIILLVVLKIMDLLLPYALGLPVSNVRSVILKENFTSISAVVRPSDELMKNTDSLLQKKYAFNTNSDGYIVVGSDAAAKKDFVDKVDIIFFGGSTTETKYVEEKYRFPYMVGDILSKQKGEKVYTLNGGVSGNHSLHSTINLISKGIKYKPTFSVLMHNVNDWALLSKTNSYFDSPISKQIIRNTSSVGLYGILKDLKDLIIPNTWRAVRMYIRNPFNTLKKKDEFEGYKRFKYSPGEIIGLFRSSILAFVQTCKSWNITPVLMTQMSRLGPGGDLAPNIKNIENPSRYQRLFNNEIRKIGVEFGVLVIDLDNELSGKSEYIYDATHLNTNGSKAAAKIIAEELMIKYEDKF